MFARFTPLESGDCSISSGLESVRNQFLANSVSEGWMSFCALILRTKFPVGSREDGDSSKVEE